jgi:hypothetical protein
LRRERRLPAGVLAKFIRRILELAGWKPALQCRIIYFPATPFRYAKINAGKSLL